MSSNPADLLRLLEPAVRPVGAPSAARAASRLPLEERDFEQLLKEAQSAGEIGGEQAAEPPTPDPLSPLAGLDAIESASLRSLIASRRNEP